MNMIEKVARAIAKYEYRSTREQAKAAIAAMREPSEGMLEMVHGNKDDVDTYQNMIDAALKEE